MHLVEPEEVGPIEGDDPRITPPRPPHRRVSVSLLFTLSVLIGLVVTIYLVLPPRHNVLITDAIDRHRDVDVTWDLERPTAPELRAWAIGVIGKDVPLPTDVTAVAGARRVQVLNRDTALMRLQLGNDQITYLVQRSHGITTPQEKRDGDLHARTWHCGKLMCAVVGPATSVSSWLPAVTKK